VQVDDHRVVIGRGQQVEHLQAAFDADRAMAGLLQQALHDHAVGGVVVGDEHRQAFDPRAMAQERIGERNDVFG